MSPGLPPDTTMNSKHAASTARRETSGGVGNTIPGNMDMKSPHTKRAGVTGSNSSSTSNALPQALSLATDNSNIGTLPPPVKQEEKMVVATKGDKPSIKIKLSLSRKSESQKSSSVDLKGKSQAHNSSLAASNERKTDRKNTDLDKFSFSKEKGIRSTPKKEAGTGHGSGAGGLDKMSREMIKSADAESIGTGAKSKTDRGTGSKYSNYGEYMDSFEDSGTSHDNKMKSSSPVKSVTGSDRNSMDEHIDNKSTNAGTDNKDIISKRSDNGKNTMMGLTSETNESGKVLAWREDRNEKTGKIGSSSANEFGRIHSASFDTKDDNTLSNDDIGLEQGHMSERGDKSNMVADSVPGSSRLKDETADNGAGDSKNQRELGDHQDQSGTGEIFEGGTGPVRSSITETGASNTVGARESVGATGTTASFLEALSEEERRVRTRHLPDVNGFRKLHKSEIKRDLALVRAMLKGNCSSISGKSGKGRRGSGEDVPNKETSGEVDKMDVEGEDVAVASEDETTSDLSINNNVGKLSSRSIKSDNGISSIPSAFLLPHESSMFTCTDEKPEVYSSNHAASLDVEPSLFRSPQVVDSIAAFNPPRPPESVGPKKKHRLLRWERNHQDVEVDLSNYRKTVQRTRQELHKAEKERERIEVVGCHLRSHFMNHLNAMHGESEVLNQMLNSTQIDCVKAAELLTSKTRSRGAKGTYVMRDVISVLKTRGSKLNLNSGVLKGVDTSIGPWCSSGIGGTSFTDTCNRPLANGWILPGDKVETLYGKGVVLYVYGHTELDPDQTVPDGIFVKSTGANHTFVDNHVPGSSFTTFNASMQSGHAQRHGFGAVSGSATSAFGTKVQASLPGIIQSSSSKQKLLQAKKFKQTKSEGELCILPPRVCIRMAYGVGYFHPKDVLLKENSTSYSDERLAIRWNMILDSAKALGTSIDTYSMDNVSTLNKGSLSSSSSVADEKGEDMEDDLTESSQPPSGIDELSCREGQRSFGSQDSGAMVSSQEKGNENDDTKYTSKEGSNTLEDRVLEIDGKKSRNGLVTNNRTTPYGSGMIPTAGLPGGALASVPIHILEKNIESMLTNGGGVLGTPTNPSIPPGFKKWEEERNELHTLEGKVLQLRNEVYRQRRIRILNERSCSSGKERSDRCESLLAEMKADLNSLKERLNDELVELGIDQEKAEELLADHYKQEQEDLESFHLPAKRKKDDEYLRTSRRKFEIASACDSAAPILQNEDGIGVNSIDRRSPLPSQDGNDSIDLDGDEGNSRKWGQMDVGSNC